MCHFDIIVPNASWISAAIECHCKSTLFFNNGVSLLVYFITSDFALYSHCRRIEVFSPGLSHTYWCCICYKRARSEGSNLNLSK